MTSTNLNPTNTQQAIQRQVHFESQDIITIESRIHNYLDKSYSILSVDESIVQEDALQWLEPAAETDLTKSDVRSLTNSAKRQVHATSILNIMREQLEVTNSLYAKKMTQIISKNNEQLLKLQKKVRELEAQLGLKEKEISKLKEILEWRNTNKTNVSNRQIEIIHQRLSQFEGVAKLYREAVVMRPEQLNRLQSIQLRQTEIKRNLQNYTLSRDKQLDEIQQNLHRLIKEGTPTTSYSGLVQKVAAGLRQLEAISSKLNAFSQKDFKYENYEFYKVQNQILKISKQVSALEQHAHNQPQQPTRQQDDRLKKTQSVRSLSKNLGDSTWCSVNPLASSSSNHHSNQFKKQQSEITLHHHQQAEKHCRRSSPSPVAGVNSRLFNSSREVVPTDSSVFNRANSPKHATGFCFNSKRDYPRKPLKLDESDDEEQCMDNFSQVQKFQLKSKVESLKELLKRETRRLPVDCEIDETGYIKYKQSGTYIIDDEGNLFNLNASQLGQLVRTKFIRI